jgi:hypothetical protein
VFVQKGMKDKSNINEFEEKNERKTDCYKGKHINRRQWW